MRWTLGFAAALAVLATTGCAHHHAPPPHPSGTLYLAGRAPGSLTLIHLSDNRVEHRRLRELSPGDPNYLIDATGGRLVVYGHDHTYSFGPAAREPARSLGESWFFVPSATPGRVWLALLGNPRTLRLRGLREVTARGATTAVTGRPPSWPMAALSTGLVIQRRTLELWNPRHPSSTRPLPGVFPVATRGSVLASCNDPCPRLYITDTRRGAGSAIGAPAGVRFMPGYGQGAFSPDGDLLALPAAAARGRSVVVLLDLASRHARVLAGASLSGDSPLIAWGRSGWLYFNSPGGHIAAYPPGGQAARLLPVRVRGSIDIAAG
jgi:hypothetical protein